LPSMCEAVLGDVSQLVYTKEKWNHGGENIR